MNQIKIQKFLKIKNQKKKLINYGELKVKPEM